MPGSSGLLASFALMRILAGLACDVSATDPATFAAVLLAAVALLASYMRRAAPGASTP